MAQVLHGSATTTARIRAQIRSSQEPIATLARRLGQGRKTVRKWRSRSSTCDLPMGPTQRMSAVLSELEEAAVVAVRIQTRLSLDDLYSVMRDAIPHLSRSTLHRALQRPVSFADIPCKPVTAQPLVNGGDRGGEPAHPLSLVPVPEMRPRRSTRLPG
jgi:transposase-like protein